MEKIDTWSDRIAVKLVGHFPRNVVDMSASAPIVSFTFDDAPLSAGTTGARIVEQAGGRSTFYLSGRLMRDGEPGETMIDADAARELAQRGHELGCHSFAHRKLGGFSKAELSADLRINDAILRDVDGRDAPRNFAVPFTMATPGTQPELRGRYLTSRGGWHGVNRGPTDPHFLKSVELREDRLEAPRTLEALDSLKQAPGWLIFFTHDISEQPGPYGCSISGFSRLVEKVASMGCQLLSVDQALESMGVRRQLMRRMGRLQDAQPSRLDDDRWSKAARVAKTVVFG